MDAFPPNKAAGRALMGGVALTIVSIILVPGGVVTGYVDQADFPAVVDAFAMYPNLTHAATLITIIATLLYVYGLLGLYRLPAQPGQAADGALRFGLVAMLFCYAVYLIEMGLRHMVVHVMQHGVGDGAALEAAPLALAMQTAIGGLHFTFITVGSLGVALVGFGLLARLKTMSLAKAAAYGMIFYGVLGLVNLLLVQHVHDLSGSTLVLVRDGLLVVGLVCLFALGLGMSRQQPGLVAQA